MARVQYLVTAAMVNWILSIPRELENHVNAGPVSVWDVKEPLRTTSTLAVTTLSASTETSAWFKCSEKRLTISMTPHKIITLQPQYIQTSQLIELCRVLEAT